MALLLSYDLAKAFHRLRFPIMKLMWSQVGLSQAGFTALVSLYHNDTGPCPSPGIISYFALAGEVSAPVHRTNGVVQGCPLSVITMLPAVRRWHQILERDCGVFSTWSTLGPRWNVWGLVLANAYEVFARSADETSLCCLPVHTLLLKCALRFAMCCS